MGKRRTYDRLIVGLVLALGALGVVLVFSASAVAALKGEHADMFHYLRKQAAFLGMGIVVMLAAARFPYNALRPLSVGLLLLSLLLMALVFVKPFGKTAFGASRWLMLGPITFQPSEIAKFALVLVLAHWLSARSERGGEKAGQTQPSLKACLAAALMAGLCAKQHDFGCAVIVVVVTVAMLFVSGVRLSYLVAAALAALPFFYHFLMTSRERVERIVAFFNPWEYSSDEGYHLYQSLVSFGSGGLWGKGLGSGSQGLLYLPFAHNDFIFASLGAQLGFAGVLFVVSLFCLLLCRGMRASVRSAEPFGLHLAFGLTLLIAVQALLNMAVAVGLLPTKGLNLPFLSYGGTNLMVSLGMAGVLANVSASGRGSEGGG